MKIELSLLLPLAAFLGGVYGAGNEEDVLFKIKGTLYQDAPNTTKLYCTFRNLWTKDRQPKKYPDPLARWSGPIMWTHTTQFEPWRAQFPVTRGIEKVAEDGFTDMLVVEMQQQGSQVSTWTENPEGSFFTNQQDFVHLPPIEVSFEFPYLSAVAGMHPSPDWYTGFYTFWLIDEYSRTWYNHFKIQTKPWDAGTDAGTTYESTDSDLDPALPIERFVPRTAPADGELRDPQGEDIPNVGEFECFLIVGDEPLIMPECDWFLDPCCNETSADCGATLPYGATPELSDAYREVLTNSPNTPLPGHSSAAFATKLSLATLCAGFVMQWLMV